LRKGTTFSILKGGGPRKREGKGGGALTPKKALTPRRKDSRESPSFYQRPRGPSSGGSAKAQQLPVREHSTCQKEKETHGRGIYPLGRSGKGQSGSLKDRIHVKRGGPEKGDISERGT